MAHQGPCNISLLLPPGLSCKARMSHFSRNSFRSCPFLLKSVRPGLFVQPKVACRCVLGASQWLLFDFFSKIFPAWFKPKIQYLSGNSQFTAVWYVHSLWVKKLKRLASHIRLRLQNDNNTHTRTKGWVRTIYRLQDFVPVAFVCGRVCMCVRYCCRHAWEVFICWSLLPKFCGEWGNEGRGRQQGGTERIVAMGEKWRRERCF